MWCFQLADVLYHVHRQGSTWHQDLKPPIFSWTTSTILSSSTGSEELEGQTPLFRAPEVDGSFDLRLKPTGRGGASPELVYLPYQGPPRINNIIGIPQWDVFPQWHEMSPRAVEAADIFSLGSTMFLLLEEIGLERTPGLGDYSRTQRRRTGKSADISQE